MTGHGSRDAPRVYRDPRRGQPPGLASLYDALLALSGGALYRDRLLLAEVGAALDKHWEKLSCEAWLGAMDYYNAAMEPAKQLGGYAARFMDIFSPNVGTGIRSQGAAALFEKCFVPGACELALVAAKHRLPYSKMHHFSQVGQDVWAMGNFGALVSGYFGVATLYALGGTLHYHEGRNR